MSDPNIYTVGWVCAITTEFVAARAFLNEEHEGPQHVAQHDNNNYSLGRIGKHNVVIAVLPDGEYGTASAAGVARDMLHSFPNIRIGLMVGIGGGAPSAKHDIRLGDIVVSAPRSGRGGVFQYDFGKTIQCQEFQATRFLDQPPAVMRTAVSALSARYEADGHQIREAIQAVLDKKRRLQKKYKQPDPSTDRLYRADVIHPVEAEVACLTSCGSDVSVLVARRARDELEDNPTIHYGVIASANQLMKDALMRDKLAQEKGVLCFEMEAAGLMNHFPCLVIRGICDYSDTHKNKQWQGYAAMAAAAYARDVLNRIPQNKVETEMRLSEFLSELYMDITGIRSQTNETKAHVEELRADGHHDKIRNWLAAPDPSTNFNKAREQFHEGTGRWLLDSEVYTKWKTEQNSFLWLFGIPGCGKTILSSSVVADLNQSEGSARTLLYFYFDFNNVDKQSLGNLVRSLIDQLYFARKNGRKETDDLYTSCDNGRSPPDQKSLLTLLLNMLQYEHEGEVWIVLDALDECHARNEATTSDLMSYIRSLRDCTANVHLLVTSRPEHDIRSAIESWAYDSEMIHLQSTEVKDDINLYIKEKVSQLNRWQKRPSIQNGIETVLSNKANGMFRWVSCQFDVLSRCLDPDSIHRELASLPRTLDETYERILKTVDPSRWDSAIRLLQFLVYSERPLTLAEAVDAVAVNTSKETRFDPECRMPCPDEIVGYCSSLAVLVKRKVSRYINRHERVEEEIVEIQLAHFSVQEYLMSDRLKGDMARELSRLTANTALTSVCLSYLLSLDHSSQPEKIEEKYPLARYSAMYWPTYVAVVEKEAGRTIPVVLEYLSSTLAINFSCRIYNPDSFRVRYRDGFNEYPSGLYYASLTGLTYSAQALVDKNANVNAEGGYYIGPLGAAFYNEHHEIVKMLVDKGAKISGQTDAHLEALENAVRQENQEHLQILVDHGYDAQDSFSCALTTASMVGNRGIVQRLLDHGADVNRQDDDNETPLHRASAKGHQEIVQLLLDNGAKINARGDYYGDVLRAALEVEHPDIVRILINKGAEVDLHDEDGSPLYIASSKGYQEIVQILIDNGANVNAKDVFGFSVLEAAAYKGHREIVQLLINNGANVNCQEERRHTALQMASRNGHEVVVDMLLRNGADVYAQGIMFDTALDSASREGHEAIVRKLLNHRPDVNNESGYFEQALSAASSEGQEVIVKLLLDQDTVIDVKHWAFMFALTSASMKGHEAIVGMLLDRGGGVDVESERFGNAMVLASQCGFKTIVEMLTKFKENEKGRNENKTLDTTYSETPVPSSTASQKQQNDLDHEEQTHSNKRKCPESTSESIEKRRCT